MSPDSPNSKLNQQFALLLRAPSTCAENVLECHLSINAKAIGDGADTVGTECSSEMVSGLPCVGPQQEPALSMRRSSLLSNSVNVLGVNVGDLSACPALVFGKLSGDAESVTELGLEDEHQGCDCVPTLPVRNSPNTSVMLCVLIPPPSMPSTALDPVEIVMTVWRRSEISAAVAKVGGWGSVVLEATTTYKHFGSHFLSTSADFQN